MKLQITIEMNNAAFDGCNGFEAAGILRYLAAKVERSSLEPGDAIPLKDFNGNRVGVAEVIED